MVPQNDTENAKANGNINDAYRMLKALECIMRKAGLEKLTLTGNTERNSFRRMQRGNEIA